MRSLLYRGLLILQNLSQMTYNHADEPHPLAKNLLHIQTRQSQEFTALGTLYGRLISNFKKLQNKKLQIIMHNKKCAPEKLKNRSLC